jgi:hypothetical protein
MLRSWRYAAPALLMLACSGGDAAPDAGIPDAGAPDADPDRDPETLAETGLYADPAAETLAPGVREFSPAYELWSDGADKRRFVYLPEGEVIDTSDMDYWVYPVGTKLWKEFSRDGVRVETRLLWKRGPAQLDWFAMAYAWNEEQTEAVAAPDGVEDALGTDHDIPSKSDCGECHAPQPDFGLGFTAILLDHDLGGLDLARLVAEELLSDPPAPPQGDESFFPIPGDATARAALGYLHANCGHCHTDATPMTCYQQTGLDLRLLTSDQSVADTGAWRTAVGEPLTHWLGHGFDHRIVAGDPAASALLFRMSVRGAGVQMPPAFTEHVDPDGVDAVAAWIAALASP